MKIVNKLFDFILNRKNVSLLENIKPVGIFHLTVKEDDKIVYEHHDNNLIVDAGFDVISGMFVNLDAGKKITSIALGDEGYVDGKYFVPYHNDVTLRNQTFIKGATPSIDKNKKLITYRMQIEHEEGNGVGAAIYSEAGLFTYDGTLFARKVFPSFIKTPDQVIFVDWALQWA